jgi:hypothetical protein
VPQPQAAVHETAVTRNAPVFHAQPMNREEQQGAWLEQLDSVLAEYDKWAQIESAHGRLSGAERLRHEALRASSADWTQVITRALAVVRRVAPGTVYEHQARALASDGKQAPPSVAACLAGVARATRVDVAAGFLQSIGELIHAELFGDFLEMAQHQLDQGYKDPAAIIAGSALEEQLRQMCKKAGIDAGYQSSDGEMLSKKASVLNADLAKAEAHSKLDEQSVTAWLALRNKAAHGQYDWYVIDQVRLMVNGVRDYIQRHPA